MIMARRCEITGKSVLFGNTVSNANNRRRTKFEPNLQWKTFYVPELGRKVKVRLSHRGMRIIDKLGSVLKAARKYQKTISPKLKGLLKEVA